MSAEYELPCGCIVTATHIVRPCSACRTEWAEIDARVKADRERARHGEANS